MATGKPNMAVTE